MQPSLRLESCSTDGTFGVIFAVPSALGRPLLLIAEPLLRDAMASLLLQAKLEAKIEATVCTDVAALQGAPQLVLWFAPSEIAPAALERECQRLHDSWLPAPLLLVLPATLQTSREQLLNLPAAGLLQAPTSSQLIDALNTVLQGGRVVQLSAALPPAAAWPTATLGLGQWLLISGLQQIDSDLSAIERLLAAGPEQLLPLLTLHGRRRELQAARALLVTLWGPISLAWGPQPQPAAPQPAPSTPGTLLNLQQRNAAGSWQAIAKRLREAIGGELSNSSGQLLSLQALQSERRSDLLLALLDQLEALTQQWSARQQQPSELTSHWQQLQSDLRQQALRRMASPYVRLPLNGSLQPVAETLLRQCQLGNSDPELPDPQPMLAALSLGQPLLIDGRLQAPDTPLAVLHLESLVANWLVRSAELISAEVLGCCAAWPELRRYLLLPELLSTRNLERLRNQLNAQQRWSNWLQRPIAIYESRRDLLCLDAEGIRRQSHTEPRDQDLRVLSWDQQLVTLALEARDALAPQVQSLMRGLGSLVVVVLTQVIGRAIGLVGRGIVQGMGRGLQRS